MTDEDLDDYEADPFLPDDEPGDTAPCTRCHGTTQVGDAAFPLPCPVCQRSGVLAVVS